MNESNYDNITNADKDYLIKLTSPGHHLLHDGKAILDILHCGMNFIIKVSVQWLLEFT